MSSTETAAAYSYCRNVAKREAKNFYYAFRVLPKHKSDAMCAVYAFMRKADDLADDESITLEERRFAMGCWTEAWRLSRLQPTDDPIFIALKDTQIQFKISDDLLEQLVAGTTMDLEERLLGVREMHVAPQGGSELPYQVYETFDALYDYCYLVASVVGLVCIKIFGYTDLRAEDLAEQTGVAFQLTNILRDVVEDAQRGRIYLPLDDMAKTGATPEQLVTAANGGDPTKRLWKLLDMEIARAREYYKAADELIPMLDPDSRPAMRVLATIYRELLQKIEVFPLLVFRRRMSVPTSRKLSILLRGTLDSMRARGKA